jgi:uncharacterized membrane protein YkvA (DUF1232 family)
MNVFISHAWRNKTAAQLIAESLENSADVWLDIKRLSAGDAIQPKIDEALARMDAVVVLWSKDAAASDGVDAEIGTAARLKKKILPVLLDETPSEHHPLLKGLYGITFNTAEPKPGLFRVQAALFRLAAGALDLDTASALNDLTSFEGFYAYVEDFRNRKDIGGEDSAMWALRSMEQCNRAYQSLSELRDQVGLTLEFVQGVFGRVQAAGDDRVQIQSILDEVIRHPRSQTKEFKVLITFIEGKLSSLPSAPKRPVALHRDAPEAARRFKRKVEQTAPISPQNAALEIIHQYIRQAPESLERFVQLAAATPSTSLRQVANELQAYLANPNDLIPDEQNGLLGFVDDAWLIHNTIYRCIEAGLFTPPDVGIEWGGIVQADPLVLQILPPQVRTTLDQLLMQYLQVIGSEMASYQPQFAADPYANSYAAFMGEGDAVGGTPAGGAQSIDDVIYTIGDKMVYYGGGR